MRKKSLSNAKLIVRVESNKQTRQLKTISVYDNRTREFWTEEKISERNIKRFLNIEDMKETLNWNLNGDSSKYQFTWGQSSKYTSEGLAYVFD